MKPVLILTMTALLWIAVPVQKSTAVAQESSAVAKESKPKYSKEDVEAIKKTALDYGQGWYEGNAKRMERALHPELAKRVLRNGKISHMSAATLIGATKVGSGKRTPADRQKTEVKIMEIYGDAACVRLEMHDWVDFMQMSKIDGQWKIVNVLWELTPEAKKKR